MRYLARYVQRTTICDDGARQRADGRSAAQARGQTRVTGAGARPTGGASHNGSEANVDTVTFAFTDTATRQRRECTLGAPEFLRRYLQHVLPPGQHRVRYFGWLHPAAKTRRAIVDTLLSVVIVVPSKPETPPPWHLRCPHCAQFTLVRVSTLARSRAPPVCL